MLHRILILLKWYSMNIAFFCFFSIMFNPYLACFLAFAVSIGLIISPKNYHEYDSLKRPVIYRGTF